jgi:hypothetical protein
MSMTKAKTIARRVKKARAIVKPEDFLKLKAGQRAK